MTSVGDSKKGGKGDKAKAEAKDKKRDKEARTPKGKREEVSQTPGGRKRN